MAKYLNDTIEEINSLKEEIMNTSEYKGYIKYLKLVEEDKKIDNITKEIVKLQKELINKKHKKQDVSDLETKLDLLYDSLYSIDHYNKYIIYSKKLNELLSKVQKEFNKYFDKLVC